MQATQDLEAVRKALATPSLSVVDSSGATRYVAGKCPNDGAVAPLYRKERRGDIISPIFKCPQCGNQFTSAAEQMLLV